MAELVEVKKLLKQWEVAFYKEHSRKPSKTDIDAAPEDIKETYMKYTKLKKGAAVKDLASPPLTVAHKSPETVVEGNSACLERIVVNSQVRQEEGIEPVGDEADGCDMEVWGSQFDRKVAQVDSSVMLKEKKDGSKSSFLTNLGKKMFEQSLKLGKVQQSSKAAVKPWKKPDTPRPMKLLPVEDGVKETQERQDPAETSAEGTAKLDHPAESKPVNFGKVFHKAAAISKHKGQSGETEVDSSVFLNKYQARSKPRQSILPSNLSGLMKKYRENLDVPVEDFENENDENTDNHDSNQDDSGESGGHSWNMPVSKLIKDDEKEASRKAKSSLSSAAEKSHSTRNRKNRMEDRYKPSVPSVEESNDISSNQAEVESLEADNVIKNNVACQNHPNKESISLTENDNVSKDKFEFCAESDNEDVSKTEGKTAKRRKTTVRPRKSKILDNSVLEDIEEESKSALKQEKTSQARSRKSKRKLDDVDMEGEINHGGKKAGEADEDENDVKKRVKKSQPAAKKRKTCPKAEVVDDGEGSVKVAAPVRKPAKTKPVSNENFIKLNMKIKTYKRKGRHMTGPQYKRKMWKEKMQARSKSYGDACFKCGQSGHWANKCPGVQATGHYEKEPVLEEDFPSMQEVAMLARGCALQARSDPVDTSVKTRKDMSPAPGETVDQSIAMETDDLDLEIQSSVVRSRPETASAPPPMKPLIECGDSETLPVTPEFVLQGLKKFGFDKFRPGQEDAVMRILCGLSTLVVLSTGGGKSLCYQLPAYLYAQRSPCITLVISPLVSLMEDQVTGLPHGIRGVCLHTNMTANQKESVLEAVRSGKAQFLLVSPEAIAGGSMSLVSSMSSLPPVAFACIDEAHCLSEWSHNFRPSYLRLCKVLQEKLGVQCFLGLTATATLSTASDVAKHLQISDFRKATVRGSPVPANLILSVSRDEDKDQALIGLLKGVRFGNLDSIIVYCTRRDQTDKVATIIRTCMNTGGPTEVLASKGRGKQRAKLEWDAESYHAGLTAAQRKRVQNAFMSSKLRVVVATVAFGMGLDKPDVRGVIHYNMPKSFESYVQEIGRAGRDGKQAECHVFLDPEGKDLCELRRHTYANTVDYRTLKKLVQKVFPACRCRDVHERHSQALLEAQMFDDDFDEESNSKDTENKEQNVLMSQGEGSIDKVTMEESSSGKRLCPGHERALPIQQTVLDLDVKEEGISTLLCYLELHDSQWLENMSNVYATCKVQCYGGPSQLQAVAKKCPPVAVAIALAKKAGKTFSNENSVEFSVIEVSDTMGWDSGLVKKELKLLQWNFDAGGPKRTGVMVEFSELAYHFRTPGDFTTEELDDILQFLHERVQRQEKSEIRNLSRLYQALKSVSHKNNWMCSEEADLSKNDKLKEILNEYFDQQATDSALVDRPDELIDEPIPEFSLGQLVSDIRAFYNLYGHEHSLNGRAIARIFHGIASPCFPATTWGRVRRFWRSHLNVDFNTLMKIATKELLTVK